MQQLARPGCATLEHLRFGRPLLVGGSLGDVLRRSLGVCMALHPLLVGCT